MIALDKSTAVALLLQTLSAPVAVYKEFKTALQRSSEKQ